MWQAQHSTQLALRSIAAALSSKGPQVSANGCKGGALQQLHTRIAALLPPVLQRSAQPCSHSCISGRQRLPDTWQQITNSLLRLQPQQQQHVQQLQHLPRHSWQHGVWPGQHCQQRWQLSQQQLVLTRSMATRVEQQAAANPGSLQPIPLSCQGLPDDCCKSTALVVVKPQPCTGPGQHLWKGWANITSPSTHKCCCTPKCIIFSLVGL